MLVEFKVRNFRSFKDEAVLSMVADSEGPHRDDLPENYVETGHPLVPRLLKVACIFGANASGKTSIFAAIDVFSKLNKFNNSLNINSKLLDACVYALNKNEPIYFEMTAFPESKLRILYSYSISIIKTEMGWLLSSEKLISVSDNGDEELIFFRNWHNHTERFEYEFGANLPIDKINVLLDPKIMNDRNTMLLSVASLIKLEGCSNLLDFISNYVVTYVHHPNIFEMNRELKLSELSDFIAKVDTGVNEITYGTNLEHSKNANAFNENGLNYFGKHVTNENNTFYLNMIDESSGTRAYITTIARCYNILKYGGLIVFDELENSLHIHLVKYLIELFQSEKNKMAQLIFTTHQGQLLDAKLLRDDQIWFTQKDNQQSKLYSLNDYDIPPGTSREKAYYHGAFGAIPKIINDPSLP
ncbi:MAG: ATP-binding protein [Candidatus Symbiobacter sp.]|nr:ATP-binding protein [Candidatus Symbiobacter sp.]